MNFSTMTNAELRRLEADRAASPDVWRAAVAEIARRDTVAATTIAKYHASPANDAPVPVRAVVVGLDLPFRDLVNLLVKIAVAAIPAMIILAFLSFLGVAVIASLLRK